MKPFSGRVRKLGMALLALWAFYLAGVNWLINSDVLPKLLAKDPERTKISWERGWTVVPGMVHARGFNIWKHTRGTVWRLQVDRGRVMVNLLALPLGTFQAVTASARGIDFELGPAETVLPRKQKTEPGFRIQFLRAAAHDVRSVKIGGLELDGQIRVRGGLDTRARGPLRVPKTRVYVDSGTLRMSEVELARDLRIDGWAVIDRHVPREHRDEGLIPFLSARVRVNGDIQDLAFLDALLSGSRLVSLGGGAGTIDADVLLTRGVIEPESRLVTEKATYTIDYLDYRATGTGRIYGFSAADTSIEEFLHFDLERFGLAARGEDSAYLQGKDLSVSLRRDGGWNLTGGGTPIDLVVDMKDAEVPDMTVYNRNLPPHGGLKIVSGSGRLSAHVEILERSSGGGGTVDLTAQDLIVEIKNKRVVGDLKSAVRVEAEEFEHNLWNPAGTRLEFRNAGAYVEDAAGETAAAAGANGEPTWWGVVEVPDGRISLGRPPEVSADFTIEAESAAPVFALFAKTQQQADKLDRRVKTDDLAGKGHLDVGAGAMSITGLEVEGGKAAVEAELCAQGGEMHGLIHVKYGALAAAAELHDNTETLHITSPRKWFERNQASFKCGR